MLTNMRILVGYDGSPYAEAAIYDLRRAGLPADADVAVIGSTSHRGNSCFTRAAPRAATDLASASAACASERALRRMGGNSATAGGSNGS